MYNMTIFLFSFKTTSILIVSNISWDIAILDRKKSFSVEKLLINYCTRLTIIVNMNFCIRIFQKTHENLRQIRSKKDVCSERKLFLRHTCTTWFFFLWDIGSKKISKNFENRPGHILVLYVVKCLKSNLESCI